MQLSHGISVDQIREHIMQRPLITTFLAGLLGMGVPVEAQQWAHLRVHETEGSRTRVSLNLPVTALKAAARELRTDRKARIQVSGSTIDLGEISASWRSLRDQQPGAAVTRRAGDSLVTITREAAGMSIVSVDRWSGEQTTITLRDTLADALSTGDGRIRFDAVATALATANGAPLTILSSDATRVEIWVDDSPEGVFP